VEAERTGLNPQK